MKYFSIVLLLVLVVIGYLVFIVQKPAAPAPPSLTASSTDESKSDTASSSDGDMVMCTMDAKLCPDGSYVGRSGPNCEFATCPSGDTKYDFVNAATSTYVSTVDWPPKREASAEPYGCIEAGDEVARGGETTERTLTNGATYCVTVSSEGAAGSVYRQYTYTTGDEAGTVIDTFSLRFPQCGNYPETEQVDCKVAQSTFSVDDFYLHTSARR